MCVHCVCVCYLFSKNEMNTNFAVQYSSVSAVAECLLVNLPSLIVSSGKVERMATHTTQKSLVLSSSGLP